VFQRKHIFEQKKKKVRERRKRGEKLRRGGD
jgi:hypothetical protein